MGACPPLLWRPCSSLSALLTKGPLRRNGRTPLGAGELRRTLLLRVFFLKNEMLAFKPLIFPVCFLALSGSHSAAIFCSLQFMEKLALAKKETSAAVIYAHVGPFIAFPLCTACKNRGCSALFFPLL